MSETTLLKKRRKIHQEEEDDEIDPDADLSSSEESASEFPSVMTPEERLAKIKERKLRKKQKKNQKKKKSLRYEEF